VGDAGEGVHAVYKPRAGERPLWDFARGTLCCREAAAYEVSAYLEWDLVPATVMREDAPMGPGSLQLFVPHDPDVHYFTLVEDSRHHGALARIALFDLLTNNADRKASHVMLADDGALLGCDHGLTFHTEPKLRTVIWDLGGYVLEAAWREDLGRLAAALGDGSSALRQRLSGLLEAGEIQALGQRASLLRGLRVLPEIDPERRPYPWPPL
jgi:uncharacterized repeat protein (TIGR03843 family)